MKRKYKSVFREMLRYKYLVIYTAALFIVSCQSRNERKQSGYADDRAQIEDLQARYMFALDNGDWILIFNFYRRWNS
jgi:hypothetical protein